ncbi:MAG: ADOP family duplicated permease [Gemmatimonadales bacterium]
MSVIHAIRARLRALVRRRSADRELRDEIGYHLERETEKLVAQGMNGEEARRMALAHFGGVQRVREEHRDVRRISWLEDFVADARFAFRALRRTPTLAVAAIVTLALGIGANVAIFSAVNAVVLRPLPFPAQDRLIVLTEENPEKHWHLETAAPANLLDWRAGVADFEDVTGYVDGLGRATLTGRGDPQIISGSYVMGNFFSTLGAHAALGRTFAFEDTWKSGTHLVVLSDKGWRDHFSGDPAIIGKSVTIDGSTVQVIGVMPPDFVYPGEGVDSWQSIEWDKAKTGEVGFRRAHYMRAVARLRPGATEAHANAELQAVVARLKQQYPATNKFMGAAMMPLHDYLIGDTRLPLLVLLTSVAFLLLIACANVGNLLLVQAAGREREAALRLALGAGRARLVRQALTESLILSAIGGVCGLAVGWAGTRLLVRLQPANMLRVHDFGVDGPVLGYVVAITLGSALIFGVAPALWMRRRSPAESLKEGGRGAMHGVRAKRWGELLVVSEVALALIMTVGAGLLVRSFFAVSRVDPGFDPHGVDGVAIELNAHYDTSTKIDAFMNALQARARAIPGVTAAALASSVPFNGTSYTTDFIAYGRPVGGYGTEIGNRTVSASYFATMRVPVLRGRTFGAEDRAGSTPVLVINAALANSYFKGEDPVGQRITFGKVITPQSIWYTIIGVVGNEHVDALDVTPRIEAFHAEAQEPSNYMVLLLRTNGDAASLTPSVRGVLRDLDPTIAPLTVATMDELRSRSLARARFLATLLLCFATIGVVLAVVGVYGVLAHTSRIRTREMGIRIALGAQAGQVHWLVVRQGLRLAIVGLIVGGAVTIATTREMASLLFGVTPTDPTTLVGVAVLLAATSVLAAWMPARKASRADPATALRVD